MGSSKSRLAVGLFGFVLTVLLIPGITGAGTTPRWVLAAVMLPLLAPLKKTEFTSAHAFGLLFIWYAAVSVTWSHPYDGLNGLFELIVMAEAFWLGSKLDDLKPVIIGFGLGIWVSSFVMVAGIDVPAATSQAGLFINSNVMGEIAGLVLVAAVVERLWWLVPGILPALVLSHSRGAFLAVAAALVVQIWRKSRFGAIAIIALGIAGLMYGGTGSYRLRTVGMRLEMWTDVLPHLSLMGVGIGNTMATFPFFATMDTLIERPDHLHNDWIEYAFELGIGSVALIGVLWLSRSIALFALFIEACFGFPLHLTSTVVLGGIVAGYAVRDRHSLRYDLAAWRISLRSCASRWRHYASHRRVPEGSRSIPA